ncbi:MAG TPA: hypothetical protein VHH36_06375, partial [Candidatus Thermoplasmatota archaeon]|nr:hypothetical protein [Candidatus Thermoplasmatota archaeon]
VNVVVEVPPEELADRGVNVGVLETRFRWTSGLDSAVTSADPPCDENLQDQDLCHDPSAPSVAADAFSRFRLEANRTRQVVSPDRATQFNLTVYNTGNAVDDFAVRLDPASAMSASWVAGFEGALLAEMPANTHRNASVSVRPPDDAVAGAHTFDLVVQSNKSTSGKTDRVQFTAVLEQRYNVTAAAPITFQRVVPAQPAVYQIPLRNNGNGWDNVTVSLENVTGGWSRALSAERVALPPFGTAVVTATVAAPPNTRSDTQMEFFALFQSSGPAERPGRVPLHAYVQQGSNVDAEFTPREQFVDLGKTVSYTLRVRNVGNIADKFAVTPEREQGGTSWRVAVEPAELVLHPLQEAFVTLNVTGPGAGDVGQTTRVLVHLRAESDGARYTRNVTARVSGPDLFVESILLDKESPYSGDEVQVSVVLGNRGNRPPSTNTSLRLEFVKDGVPALIGGQERGFSSVDLGGGVRITERFAWNTTGIEGPLVLRAAIDAPNAIAEIDDSPASNEATKPLVIRTYDIRITPPQALPAHPGERVSYGADPHVFVVEYRGNQPTEPVRIRLESEHGWGLVARDLELPQFTPIPIPIDLAVPESPGAARDALRLTVTPTLRPEAAVVSSITTLIVDEAPPTVVSVRATPEVAEVNEEVALEVVATDPTGVSEVVAFLALPGAEGNGTRSFPLARADGDRWVLRQGFDAPGVYRYYVTVRDNAEPANENSTASVVRSFRVSPGTQPLVKLADGQGTTVRTGPPIRLNVTDPLGIGAANYTIKGVRFDMERPFQIDTTGFQAGTVEVLVTAENIYGAAATSRFTFTVDNTQPAIRKVTLKPESPDTNQETTLRVETDADAAAVSVVLRNNGQVVDTRNATKRAVGVWELTFQPGEGDNVLDVTATDAAGNSRVMEGAVRFDAGSRGLIPWGGPAIAVLAAACAALLLGTRRRG